MSSPYGAPAAGGLVTTTLVTLGVLLVLYVVVHRWGLP
jgi:hypothetical protein